MNTEHRDEKYVALIETRFDYETQARVFLAYDAAHESARYSVQALEADVLTDEHATNSLDEALRVYARFVDEYARASFSNLKLL